MDRGGFPSPLKPILEIVLKAFVPGPAKAAEAKSKRNAAVHCIISLRLRLPLLARIFRAIGVYHSGSPR